MPFEIMKLPSKRIVFIKDILKNPNKFTFNIDLGFSPDINYGFLEEYPLYEFSGSIYTGYQFNKCINAGVGIGYKYEYISSDCNSYGIRRRSALLSHREARYNLFDKRT